MMLTLAQAQTIIDAVFARVAQAKCKPLAAAIVDAGGHIIAAARQDGASTLRPDIALAKATGALALGISSRTIADLAARSAPPIAAVGQIAARGVIPSPGGVIILDANGIVLGAAGASGDTGDTDEACVIAGIEAVGLQAQPALTLS
jgi:uncharacterized protein GlcG (DUF336 family)